MTEPSEFLPVARREGIVVKEVDGELLVYDRTRNKAHCLNPTAALVWKSCDGNTNIEELASDLSAAIGARVDETVVQLALKQLSADHLLTKRYDVPVTAPDLSRRALIGRLGLAAVILPLITTISAPTAFAATSSCTGPCTPGGPANGGCAIGCTCLATGPGTGVCRNV